MPSEDIHKVDYTNNFLSINVNHTITEMVLNLTSDKPYLYCLTLDVKDVADNVHQCRRFLLVDVTTFIIPGTDFSVYVSIARYYLYLGNTPQ